MNAQKSALERKERHEQFLTSLAVPVNPNLPLVESEAKAKFRDAKEVARRAVVLYFVISVAHGASRETVVFWLKDEGLTKPPPSNHARYHRLQPRGVSTST